MADIPEPEILEGRESLPDTQNTWASKQVRERISVTVETSWYGTELDVERTAFAHVRFGSDYERLVGEFLRVRCGARSVIVYCLGRADLVTDLGLTRRAFAKIAGLYNDEINAVVEIVE